MNTTDNMSNKENKVINISGNKLLDMAAVVQAYTKPADVQSLQNELGVFPDFSTDVFNHLCEVLRYFKTQIEKHLLNGGVKDNILYYRDENHNGDAKAIDLSEISILDEDYMYNSIEKLSPTTWYYLLRSAIKGNYKTEYRLYILCMLTRAQEREHVEANNKEQD